MKKAIVIDELSQVHPIVQTLMQLDTAEMQAALIATLSFTSDESGNVTVSVDDYHNRFNCFLSLMGEELLRDEYKTLALLSIAKQMEMGILTEDEINAAMDGGA